MPVWIWIVLLFFVAVPIGQAIARLIESKAQLPPIAGDGEAAERFQALERQVQYLTEQLAGLQDNQEFLTRLLENRTSEEPAKIEEERR